VALIAGAVRIYMTWPRRPDLRAFDSAQSPAKAAIAAPAEAAIAD
jgi:hypothetical protein